MQANILIVDDSAVDRNLIGMIIQKSLPDVVIHESADGVNLKHTLISQDIKVCILDLKMPLVDGYDILAEMKSDKEIMDIPVIVCTGMQDMGSFERVLRLGAYDYFSKPLTEEAMKIALPLKVRNAIDLSNRTQHIVHLSRIDRLTGLYSRDYFKTQIFNSRTIGHLPTSILITDINGLKVANDAFGSDVGDRFLVSAAEILKQVIPKTGMVSRWGGDEFAVFLDSRDKEEAEGYAERLRAAFSEVEHSGLKLSMACGWDTMYKEEQSIAKIFNNAEDAMLRDKILEDVSVRSRMIGTILKTLHEKNPREEAHSRRVSELCFKMGEELGLGQKELQEIKVIGLLHDIGKIAIDEHILNKPGHPTQEEWLEIKRHPEIGYRLLTSSTDMQSFADVVLSHHERMDGKGYPNRLKGDAIPMQARILSIIDSYDAMTCERTYRHVFTDREAAVELMKHADKQFDRYFATIFIDKVLKLPLKEIEREAAYEEQMLLHNL